MKKKRSEEKQLSVPSDFAKLMVHEFTAGSKEEEVSQRVANAQHSASRRVS